VQLAQHPGALLAPDDQERRPDRVHQGGAELAVPERFGGVQREGQQAAESQRALQPEQLLVRVAVLGQEPYSEQQAHDA
jgi:hypothetical protein